MGLWATAMLTVLLGCLYAAQPYQFLKNGLLCRNGSKLSFTSSIQRKCPEKVSKLAGVLTVMLFISVVCFVLVVLYYFYYPTVYIIIAVFGAGAGFALYTCLSPFVALLPFLNSRIPPNRLPILWHQPDAKFFLTVGFSAAMVIWWTMERNASHIWLLHNFLGVCFIVFIITHMMEMDTWILMLLLVTMLVYDVFFVFISPYVFSGGNVMVQAATGGKGTGDDTSGAADDGGFTENPSEMLPVLFSIPRLVLNELAIVCSHSHGYTYNYAFLGYGDVAMPGMLVAQALCFDLQMWPLQSIKVYFLVALSSYGFGLWMAFVALSITESAQPALLYIVPCLLIALLSTAAVRGHLTIFLRVRTSKNRAEVKSLARTCEEAKPRGKIKWPLVNDRYDSDSCIET